MNTLTQPLRDEHRELFPQIAQLRITAGLIGGESNNWLLQAMDESLEFLKGHLLPHAQAEDAALYPVVARLLGGPKATDTMKRDHIAVKALIEELDGLAGKIKGGESSPELDNELRRVLYGLYTLVSVHFAKEEEIYLPVLDAGLTPGEADEMFEHLEEAAHEAHAAVHA